MLLYVLIKTVVIHPSLEKFQNFAWKFEKHRKGNIHIDFNQEPKSNTKHYITRKKNRSLNLAGSFGWLIRVWRGISHAHVLQTPSWPQPSHHKYSPPSLSNEARGWGVTNQTQQQFPARHVKTRRGARERERERERARWGKNEPCLVHSIKSSKVNMRVINGARTCLHVHLHTHTHSHRSPYNINTT